MEFVVILDIFFRKRKKDNDISIASASFNKGKRKEKLYILHNHHIPYTHNH